MEALLIGDVRQGWFKFFIAELPNFVSDMLNPQFQTQFELVPFMYGRLDEEVAFDNKLSIPLVAIAMPTFALKDKNQKLMLVPISEISPEHEKRIYIPAGLIMGIIPVEPGSQVVEVLVNASSVLHKPLQEDVGKIIDLSKGRVK